jgi:hypothetical protein
VSVFFSTTRSNISFHFLRHPFTALCYQVRPPTTLTEVRGLCQFFLAPRVQKISFHFLLHPFTVLRYHVRPPTTLTEVRGLCQFLFFFLAPRVQKFPSTSYFVPSTPLPSISLPPPTGVGLSSATASSLWRHTPSVTEITLSRTTVPLAAILEPSLCNTKHVHVPYDLYMYH